MATQNKIISRGSKNRLTNTAKIDLWTTTGTGTSTANDTGTLDPIGGNAADLINDTSSGDVYIKSMQVNSTDAYLLNPAPWANKLLTFSIYLKNNTSTKTRIRILHLSGTATDVRCEIDWATKTCTKIDVNSPVFSDADIRYLDNGWIRASVTIKYVSGNIQVSLAPASDGTGTLTGSVWAWGAQLEEGQFPTSYLNINAADPIVPDYFTIPAWITGTNNTLTVGTDINVGLLLDETYYVASGDVSFTTAGAGSNNNYRRLTTFFPYDPITNTGARIVGTFAATGTNSLININENRVTIDNIGIFADYQGRQSSGDNRIIFYDRASNCRMWDTFICSKVGRTTTMTGIYIAGTGPSAKASKNSFFNVIISGCGPGGNGGLTTGVLWNQYAELGGLFNCAIYGNQVNSGDGVFNVPGQASGPSFFPKIINCIVAGNKRDIVGQYLIAKNNITSDASAIADGLEVPEPGIDPSINYADPNSKGGIDPFSIWLSPDQQDFRLKAGSPAVNAGQDAQDYFLDVNDPYGVGTTVDFTATTREADGHTWDVGPYEGIALPISTAYTIQTKSVGRDPSRDFSSLGSFVRNLPRSLYYSNEKWIAECYSDVQDNIGAPILIEHNKVIVSSENNIEVRAIDNINPKSLVGHKIKFNLDVDTVTPHRAALWITTNYTLIEGIMVWQAATSATTRNARTIELFANDCTLNAIYGLFNGTYSRTIGYVFDIESDRCLVTNCLARGSDTTAQGASLGFNVTDNCTSVLIYHCVAYRMKGGTNAQFSQAASGFFIRQGVTSVRVSGCIAMESAGTGVGTFDYFMGAGLDGNFVLDRCISGDTTALGVKSLISQSASTIFKNAPINDYRLIPGSPAINLGDNFIGVFDFDIAGNPRVSPYDVGIYEGVVFSPLRLTPRPMDAHRLCTLWEIARTDGVVHLLCSTNEPIEHEGLIYKPTGQASASARRMESALKEHNVEVKGSITSNEIEAEDLAAGVFTGARITERIVDWRYPWTTPYSKRTYRIANLEYDQDSWRAELAGPTIVLDQKVGELIGVDCPYDLGDSDCQVKLSLFTQVNKTVTTVNDSRREFISTGLSGTGVSTDDYFGKGKVSFISGQNAGLSFEVKSYVGSTKTIRLAFKTPYPIAVNDRFNLVPGCRKRLVLDCIPKFDNGINFGGRAHIPGTDKAFDTPTR